MALLRNISHLIRENRRAFVGLNLLYFGLTVLAMVLVSARPELIGAIRGWIKARFNPELLNAVAQGMVYRAILLTFINNFLYGTIFAISLPSLVIPFLGIFIGLVRALLWGLALSPADPSFRMHFLVQIPTWLLEGEGYVLAMFAVFVLWRNCFWPHRAEAKNSIEGYRAGLRQSLPLYAGVLILLAAGAVYEPLATIYLLPLVLH